MSSAVRVPQPDSQVETVTGPRTSEFFEALLSTEWRRAQRYRVALAVLFVDVDGFDRYRADHEARAAEAALRRIGKSVAASLRRAGDAAVLAGGDGFWIVLPGVDFAGASVVADRIVRNIELLKIANGDRALTASVGGATIKPQRLLSPALLTSSARHALNEARARGGNQCVVRQPDDI